MTVRYSRHTQCKFDWIGVDEVGPLSMILKLFVIQSSVDWILFNVKLASIR